MAKLNSKELQNAHADLKTDARQRIAERGILQFRADLDSRLRSSSIEIVFCMLTFFGARRYLM
jgi:hypothetical protein